MLTEKTHPYDTLHLGQNLSTWLALINGEDDHNNKYFQQDVDVSVYRVRAR